MESNEDDSYLAIKQENKAVMTNLSELGDKLKFLKMKMLEAEAAFDQAKKSYEHFANVVIPQEMAGCGIDSISLSSGGSLTLQRKFYCQPNKNPEDRATIVAWLRAHGGGHLVKHDATVASEDFEKLEATGIPFVENTVVDTNKLKAFLKAGVAPEGGVQLFDIDEIPKCAHFQQVLSVDVKM